MSALPGANDGGVTLPNPYLNLTIHDLGFQKPEKAGHGSQVGIPRITPRATARHAPFEANITQLPHLGKTLTSVNIHDFGFSGRFSALSGALGAVAGPCISERFTLP